MSHDKHLRCSFCGKSKDSVRKFISGPSVYICNECIALCNEILAEVEEREVSEAITQVPTPAEIKDVLVQHVLDLGRRGDLGDRLGDLPLLVLRQDLVAEGDALITNVDRRAGNELPDRVLRLAAEGAAEVLIVGHLALVWESRVTGASRHFFFPSSISWKFAITWSISPYSLASSADMKRSRSMSFSMCSTGLPVCLA